MLCIDQDARKKCKADPTALTRLHAATTSISERRRRAPMMLSPMWARRRWPLGVLVALSVVAAVHASAPAMTLPHEIQEAGPATVANVSWTYSSVGEEAWELVAVDDDTSREMVVLKVEGGSDTCTLPRLECEAGQFLTGTSRECEPCPAGTFIEVDGDEACNDCPGNSSTYSRSDGSLVVGSVQAEACMCDVGYTGDHGQVCEACDIGKYKSEVGNATCSECPVHSSTYSMVDGTAVTGSVDVESCMCNAVRAIMARHAQLAGGDVKSEVGNATCTNCGGDGMSSPVGSTAGSDCVCAAGRFSQNDACVLCSAGDYKEDLGNVSCLRCESAVSLDDRTMCMCAQGEFGVLAPMKRFRFVLLETSYEPTIESYQVNRLLLVP